MLSGPHLQSYIIAVETRKSKRIFSNYQKSRGPLLDPTLFVCFCLFCFRIFSGCFDTSGSMIPLLVPEIEGGSPERHGEEGAGLGLQYSSRLI